MHNFEVYFLHKNEIIDALYFEGTKDDAIDCALSVKDNLTNHVTNVLIFEVKKSNQLELVYNYKDVVYTHVVLQNKIQVYKSKSKISTFKKRI